MAEAHSDSGSLKEAILQVWTPTVGLQSIEDIWRENMWSIFRTIIDKSEAFVTKHSYVLIFGMVKILYKTGFKTNLLKYFDKHGPFQLEKSIVSGSWSEGLFVFFESSAKITPPDVDFMCVLKNINFTASDQFCGNLTVREDTPFVKAYITDEACAKLWEDFLHEPCDQQSLDKHRLSSVKLKEKLCQNYSRVGNLFRPVSDTLQLHVQSEEEKAAFMVHNNRPVDCTRIFHKDAMRSFVNALYISLPDVADEMMRSVEKLFYKFLPSTDIVLALSCDGWPLSAKEWITRERIWPDEELVNKIAQSGFHIVPKSSPEGDFRLSFSSPETTLIKHWSPLQHKIMRSFKAVVKCHQTIWSSNIKEIISTYHLKTIAFWHFEKTAQDSFTEETVATHLVLLLQGLAEALRKLELPMYFMPKVNLLKGVENYEEAVDTVEKIFHLCRDYAAITHTVAKLAKIDLNATLENILKDFDMVWKSVKKTRSSDVEDQTVTPILIGSQFLSIFTHILQDNLCQQKGVHYNLEKVADEYLCLCRNFIDIMVSSTE